MSDTTLPEEFAFPWHDTHECKGMTLRDYFAAQVIAPYIAALEAGLLRTDPVPENFQLEASNAYAVADAMLAARQS